MKTRFQLLAALGMASLWMMPSAFAAVIQDHYGKWLGKISIPNGPTVSTGIELFARADGSLGASMASPDQGVFALSADQVSATGNVIEIGVAMVGITWHLTAAPDALAGEVRQGTLVMPVALKRVSSFGGPVRPQMPQEPLPYSVEDLVVTAKDGVLLAGTLTRPSGHKRVTAVVLLSGSGPTDRDETVAAHRPFAVLADYLTRNGIAVYRYDKRGVLRSTGDYSRVVTATLADDGFAAVKALRARKDIARVGVIGHSEGGLLAAMIAADHPQAVTFAVSLAGPGLKGIDLIVLQDRVGYERRGLPQADAATLTRYSQHFYETVMSNDTAETRLNALKALYGGLSPAEQALVQKFASGGSLSLQQASLPYESALLMTDVPAYWRRVKCPVLALNGTLDVQVPAVENLAGIQSALAAGGNARIQIESLPGLNHLFQTAQSGLGDEYARLDETIAPEVLRRVAAFVGAQR
ncbi:MAG TPA: alpha/beta fold hydrolase [Steroidobacteraceae bacterium]|nr:alpha/beta fold hydrolase [Steroidobacteraceae bacterium]